MECPLWSGCWGRPMTRTSRTLSQVRCSNVQFSKTQLWFFFFQIITPWDVCQKSEIGWYDVKFVSHFFSWLHIPVPMLSHFWISWSNLIILNNEDASGVVCGLIGWLNICLNVTGYCSCSQFECPSVTFWSRQTNGRDFLQQVSCWCETKEFWCPWEIWSRSVTNTI